MGKNIERIMSMNMISKFPEKDNRKEWWYIIPVGLMFALCLVGFGILVYLILSLPDYFTESIEVIGEPIQQVQEFVVPEAETVEEKPDPIVHLTDDDIIAQIIMHEAGNQEMIGKVAVAMTVLNRCDYFDLNVEQVTSAYAYPYLGEITPDCYRAIEIARNNRDLFPADFMYFNADGYHGFGQEYIQIQDHYFSTQETKTIKDIASGK
jgi:hypothetical protein